MWNLRLITKREILLWKATLDDSKQESARLHREVEHYRSRCEALTNIILAEKHKVMVSEPKELTFEEAEKMQSQFFELFGEEGSDMSPEAERKMLEELQK